MNAESKLQPQTEKPNHYMYLKEFRVEQCTSFLQHKCNQHKPFVCFNWHFDNQRRRRPIRRKDGTFNYSADNYCTKYDETKGKCPDGDECPFLHRTAGDTERRYHLRYYKTCMCVHETDSRGFCVKNGQHCAFAHGIHDQRPPVYDIKELESMQTNENQTDPTSIGPNTLEKERNLMNEDPKWQDTNYVLANYKTEPCKRPPRLCRQGYACPQYHNSKDKRRSPRKFKYRSTPCPNVKHGEEWGEPDNCEAGDNCQYCHTRTEQQFHPEIYKSTKCNDVQQQGYCPRSVFCAFAHVQPYGVGEELVSSEPPSQSLLSDIISNALPSQTLLGKDGKINELQYFSKVLQNGTTENGSSESVESGSMNSNHDSHNRAPGSQLHNKGLSKNLGHNPMSNGATMSSLQSAIINNSNSSNLLSNAFQEFSPDVSKQILAIENDSMLSPMEKEQRKRLCLYGISQFDMDNSISVGISSGILNQQSAPVNIPSSLSNSLGLLPSSKPMSIPSNNFSPSSHSNIFMQNDGFGMSGSAGSGSKLNSSFPHNNDVFLAQNSSHLVSSLNEGIGSMSPDIRLNFDSRMGDLNHLGHDQNMMNSSASNNIYDNAMNKFPLSPIMNSYDRDDNFKNIDLWKMEMDRKAPHNMKSAISDKQRDDYRNMNNKFENMSLQNLKGLQMKLRSDLEEVEKVLYSMTAKKCLKCEENNRAVTLSPCNHFVLCEPCASHAAQCPYCQTTIEGTLSGN